jgi:hypothetical protein
MTIREVFNSFLEAQEQRLRPRTYSDYESVIELFGHSMHRYAWNTLPEGEYDRFVAEYEKEGKEFADIYSHDLICPNIWEFLHYFMPNKVMTSDEFIEKTAPRVIRKLLRWMAEEGLIDRDTMEEHLPE